VFHYHHHFYCSFYCDILILIVIIAILVVVIIVVDGISSSGGVQGPGSAEGRPGRPHTPRQVLPPLHRQVLREGHAQRGRA